MPVGFVGIRAKSAKTRRPEHLDGLINGAFLSRKIFFVKFRWFPVTYCPNDRLIGRDVWFALARLWKQGLPEQIRGGVTNCATTKFSKDNRGLGDFAD